MNPLIILFFISFIPPSLHQLGGLGGLTILEEEQISTILLGAGSDGISLHFVEGNASNIQLQWGNFFDKLENEWTFEIITLTGGLYNFVDDDGYLLAVAPDGSSVDISSSYAEFAEVATDEAADALGDYVISSVSQVHDALGVGRDDD